MEVAGLNMEFTEWLFMPLKALMLCLCCNCGVGNGCGLNILPLDWCDEEKCLCDAVAVFAATLDDAVGWLIPELIGVPELRRNPLLLQISCSGELKMFMNAGESNE